VCVCVCVCVCVFVCVCVYVCVCVCAVCVCVCVCLVISLVTAPILFQRHPEGVVSVAFKEFEGAEACVQVSGVH